MLFLACYNSLQVKQKTVTRLGMSSNICIGNIGEEQRTHKLIQHLSQQVTATLAGVQICMYAYGASPDAVPPTL